MRRDTAPTEQGVVRSAICEYVVDSLSHRDMKCGEPAFAGIHNRQVRESFKPLPPEHESRRLIQRLDDMLSRPLSCAMAVTTPCGMAASRLWL